MTVEVETKCVICKEIWRVKMPEGIAALAKANYICDECGGFKSTAFPAVKIKRQR